MDAWELDGIKIEIGNTMFDCSFLALSLSFPQQSFINLWYSFKCFYHSWSLSKYVCQWSDKFASLFDSTLSITSSYREVCHSLKAVLQRRLLMRKTHHSIITLSPFIYWLCIVWSVFGGQRSLNSEAKQTCQVAVSLLSWQFSVLCNHSLSIKHYQKRLIWSRLTCGLFGVLICGYDLTRTFLNLVSWGSFSLCNL